MTKRIRILLLSTVTLLLAIGLLVGATFALFSDSARVTNHLQAGTLKLELWRDKVTATNLTEAGYLETKEDTAPKDFTGSTKENIFGLEEGALIVPTSVFTAQLRIENVGNVAFGYWLEIVVTDDSGEELAAQLQLTFTPSGGTGDKKLLSSDSLIFGSDASPLAKVSAEESASFTVSVEFLDLSGNNLAMAQEVTFDLIVHAIQSVA